MCVLSDCASRGHLWDSTAFLSLFAAGVMYFGDGKLDTIEVSNLDGSARTVVLNESEANPHYFGLALDDDFIYFTDWSDTSSSK